MPRRAIQDNLLLAHELVRQYDRKHISRRCSMKIDLKKAYDTVSWSAVILLLKKLDIQIIFI